MAADIEAARDTEDRRSRSDACAAAFRQLPDLLERNASLIERGRFLTVDCLVGTPEAEFLVSIRAGRITQMQAPPPLMRPWRFAYRATPEAWCEFWRPYPNAGWHDLLALTKRRAARLEGDIHPFMANLQYFKELLALPRTAGDAA